MPVVEVLPLVQLSLEASASKVDGRLKFGSVGLLRTLHLAIEVLRARADGSELDPLMPWSLLERQAKNSPLRSVWIRWKGEGNSSSTGSSRKRTALAAVLRW